jgi:methylated-DNA-protein-cysteine methyltransferase-like protein
MGYFEEVQRIVLAIPRGKVMTYGEVARAAGYPGTARQVAWALRGAGTQGLPWQRVVGQGGRILLPDEAGLHQRLRLEMEGVEFSGQRVNMNACAFKVSDPKKMKSLKNLPRIPRIRLTK